MKLARALCLFAFYLLYIYFFGVYDSHACDRVPRAFPRTEYRGNKGQPLVESPRPAVFLAHTGVEEDVELVERGFEIVLGLAVVF